MILKSTFFIALLLLTLCGFNQNITPEDSIALRTNFDKIEKILNTNPDSAKTLIDSCLRNSKEKNYKYGIAHSTHLASLFYAYRGMNDTSFHLDSIANKLFKELDNKTGLFATYNLIGNYYSNTSNYNLALENYNKALKIAENEKDQNLLAMSYNNIGAIYLNLSDFNIALENFLNSLKIKENNCKNRIDSVKLAHTLSNIGVIHHYQQDTSNALFYYQRALKISQKCNNLYAIASCYNNIGNSYYQYNDLQNAEHYYYNAYITYKALNHTHGIICSITNIGVLNTLKQDYKKSSQYLKQALSLAKKHNSIQNEIAIYNNLANLNLELAKISSNKIQSEKYSKKAIHYAKQSLQINSNSNLNHLSNSHRLISNSYVELEDFKNALTHKNKHIHYKDSLYDNNKSLEIKKINSIYSVHQKELEIENLEKLNKVNTLLVKKMKTEQMLLYALITVSVLIILLLIFLRKKLRKSNKTILSQNETIKKQNESLTCHQNNLEELVLKRTQELNKAKNKAEESDRLKSSFLANISHEIRTPMNAIVGFIELLDDPDIPDNVKTDFKQLINQSSSTLLRLIDDILDISKMDAEQLSIYKSRFNLTGIINNLIKIFDEKKKNIDKSHINIIAKYDQKEVSIFSDPIRIEQIISNLLDNALKFTHEGIICVNITLDEKRVTISVKDQGIGIKEEDYDLIFESFTKIEDKTSKLYRGTGLGLAISKRLAYLLGGEIYVESSISKPSGSVFYLSIPIE